MMERTLMALAAAAAIAAAAAVGVVALAFALSCTISPAVLALNSAPRISVTQNAATAAAPALPKDDTPDALRRTSFNLDENGIALGGYDPVSYFDKSGPKEGKPAFTFVYRGVTYRFASEENKKKFESERGRKPVGPLGGAAATGNDAW